MRTRGRKSSITPEKVKEIQEILEAAPGTIRNACKIAGISYTAFLARIATLGRSKEFKRLAVRVRPDKRAIKPQSEIKPMPVQTPDKLEKVYTYKEQSAPLLELLPTIIFKSWVDPILGKTLSIKCRLAFRVEEVREIIYYVACYEYMSHPQQYTADQFLHAFSTENANTALAQLAVLTEKRLTESISEPELGEVKYSLQDNAIIKSLPAHTPPVVTTSISLRSLACTTPAKGLADGEYKCIVAGQNAKITHNGQEYWVLLPEQVMRQNATAKVKDNRVTVYI